MNFFRAQWMVCRYEIQGQVHQQIARATDKRAFVLSDRRLDERLGTLGVGEGDVRFAEALAAIREHDYRNPEVSAACP